MDKTAIKNLIRVHARNDEDALFLSRLFDLYNAHLRRSAPVCSDFLDLARQALAVSFFKAAGIMPYTLSGGYADAERRILFFTPDWLSPEDYAASPDFPLAALRIRSAEPLTHRDYLGALLALGIKREKVGDILVDDEGCCLVLFRELAGFVLQNYDRAGRVPLSCEAVSLSDVQPAEAKTKLVRDTVASLRLDSLVSAAFSISLGNAQDLVRAGAVSVDHLLCTDADRILSGGETLSVRGHGRAVLTEVGALSRKGRIFVELRRFV